MSSLVPQEEPILNDPVALPSNANALPTAISPVNAPYGHAHGATLFYHATPQQRMQWKTSLAQGGLFAEPSERNNDFPAAFLHVPHQLLEVIDEQRNRFPLALHRPSHSDSLNDATDSKTDASREQQLVVQNALSNQDVYLIQGMPAAGKRKVLVQLAVLAVQRRERVLCMGWSPDRLAQLMPQIEAATDCSCVIIQADGSVTTGQGLPFDVVVQEQLTCLQAAQPEFKAINEQIHLYQHLLQEIPRWHDQRIVVAQIQSDIEQCQAEKQSIMAAARELSIEKNLDYLQPDSAKQMTAEMQRHQKTLAEMRHAEEQARKAMLDQEEACKRWRDQVIQQEEVVALRNQPNWLSWRWWRVAFQGRALERLSEFRTRSEEANQELLRKQAAIEEAIQQSDIEIHRHQSAREQIIQQDLNLKLESIDQHIASLRTQQENILRLWSQHLQSINHESNLLPLSETSILQVQETIQSRMQQLLSDRVRREQEWQASHLTNLRDELLGMAQVIGVAGMEASAIPKDVWNSVIGSGVDRLLLFDAECWPQGELLCACSWAKQKTLMGTPLCWPIKPTSAFHRLLTAWQTPPRTPSSRWYENQTQFICQLIDPSSCLDQPVHWETLSDHPTVELGIVQPEGEVPHLASVVFPKDEFQLESAKKLLAEHLEESTLDQQARSMNWHIQPDRISIEFHLPLTEKESQSILIQPGIVEELAAFAVPDQQDLVEWRTRRMVFTDLSYWTVDKIQDWLATRLHWFDCGRVGTLTRRWQIHEHFDRLIEVINEQTYGLQGTHANSVHEWLRISPSRLKNAGSTIKSTIKNVKSTKDVVQDRFEHQKEEAQALLNALEQWLFNENRQTVNSSSILVLANEREQLQLLESGWRERESAHSLSEAVQFMMATEAMGRHADAVFISLWPYTHQDGMYDEVRFCTCMTALMAARRYLLWVGDLAAAQACASGRGLVDNSPAAQNLSHATTQLLKLIQSNVCEPKWMVAPVDALA